MGGLRGLGRGGGKFRGEGSGADGLQGKIQGEGKGRGKPGLPGSVDLGPRGVPRENPGGGKKGRGQPGLPGSVDRAPGRRYGSAAPGTVPPVQNPETRSPVRPQTHKQRWGQHNPPTLPGSQTPGHY